MTTRPETFGKHDTEDITARVTSNGLFFSLETIDPSTIADPHLALAWAEARGATRRIRKILLKPKDGGTD